MKAAPQIRARRVHGERTRFPSRGVTDTGSRSTLPLLLGGVKSYLRFGRPYSMAALPVDATYAYAVWMRHVQVLAALGVNGPLSDVVEIGPGNSAATGICAILSGARTYTGLDVLDHLANDQVVRLLRETEVLFASRASIPGSDQFPNLRPVPAQHGFPRAALSRLFASDERASEPPASLRQDVELIATGGRRGQRLRFHCPWSPASLAAASVDLVFSHAVLQEIPHDDTNSPLQQTFDANFTWLRPGGIASHQIDMAMYGCEPWNVHWTWSDTRWTLIRGRRENFPNREPLSTYVTLARRAGFAILAARVDEATGAPRHALQPRFAGLPDLERRARSVHLVLQRPA